MKGAIELVAFLGLSAVLHAGIVLQLPQGGGGGQGAGGQDIVSLQASPESLAPLLERWQDIPETAQPVSLANPVPEVFEPPVFRAETAPSSLPQEMPAQPIADAGPQVVSPVLTAPVRIGALSTLGGPALPTLPDNAPVRPGADSAPARPEAPSLVEPQANTDPVVETTPPSTRAALTSPRPAPRPDRPSNPAPARQAAGSGGGATQGVSPQPAAQPSLSAGDRQSRMAAWGAQIQRRIERSRPRVRGTGQVILQLTILPGGQLAGVGIARSSGDPAVDQAAVQAVRRAGRFPAAPEGLTEASYGFSLPVSFR